MTFTNGMRLVRGGMMSSEDYDFLLRSYKGSRFGNVPEILLGYREATLNIKKQYSMRSFVIKSLHYNLFKEGAYGEFLRSASVVLLKLSVNVLAIATGLNHRLLSHRARPIAAYERGRWDLVWRELKNDISTIGLEGPAASSWI